MAEVKEINNLEQLNELGRAQEIDLTKDNKLVREIVGNLKKTIRKKNILALSAPAIGYNKRIFCIDYADNEIKTYINPVISNYEELELSREVCTSIPDKEFVRPRNGVIDVIYQTPTGKINSKRFNGVAAHIFQHEVDHLNGVTLEDIGLEIEKDFDEASEEERQEIINMYLDSLDIRQKKLDEIIEEDEELSLINDRLKFTEALARGDIKLEQID